MKFRKFVITGVVLAGTLSGGVIAGALPADAVTTHPAGGTWDYGVAGYPGSTWSNYHHPSKKHRSTACNTSWCTRSADGAPGSWSRISVAASVSNNTAFYFNY